MICVGGPFAGEIVNLSPHSAVYCFPEKSRLRPVDFSSIGSIPAPEFSLKVIQYRVEVVRFVWTDAYFEARALVHEGTTDENVIRRAVFAGFLASGMNSLSDHAIAAREEAST